VNEQAPPSEQPGRTAPLPEPEVAAVPAAFPEGAVRVRVRVRRAPRYRPFVLTGALLGLAVGIVVSLVFGTSIERFPTPVLVGYLAVIGLLVGGVLGAGAAVLAERSADRSQRG